MLHCVLLLLIFLEEYRNIHCQAESCKQPHKDQQGEPHIFIHIRVEDDGEHHQMKNDGIELSKPPGAGDLFIAAEELDSRKDHQHLFADKHREDRPQIGHPLPQAGNNRYQHQLICQRIEDPAKRGLHMKVPGNKAIQHVAEARNCQDRSG